MSSLAFTVAQACYLFSPFLVASALSGVVLKLDLFPWMKRPLDFGATVRGHRVFGANKTWRGLVATALGCVVGVAIQRFAIGGRAGELALVDYAHSSPLWIGVAMGVGATIGELPNSFVKRQLGVAPGTPARGAKSVLFYVWDQVDLLTTTWPLMLFWVRPTWLVVGVTFALAAIVHPLLTLIGYLVGARKSAR